MPGKFIFDQIRHAVLELSVIEKVHCENCTFVMSKSSLSGDGNSMEVSYRLPDRFLPQT